MSTEPIAVLKIKEPTDELCETCRDGIVAACVCDQPPTRKEMIMWMEQVCDYYHLSPCANAILNLLRTTP